MLLNLYDYERKAKACMPSSHFDYYQGGSNDEITLEANQTAYRQLQLRSRVLMDVSSPDMITSVLGTKIALPIIIAPSAVHRLAHRDGELATARTAKAQNTIMIASTLGSYTMEEIAKVGSTVWFQLYIYRSRKLTVDFVKRAEKAGYKALVLTVDTARLGRRERDLRNKFVLPKDIPLANFIGSEYGGKLGDDRETLTWESIAWLRSVTKLPIILKGIITAEDARLAVKHTIDGIIVSNHGGRQLDGSVPTIEALPEVVAAVKGKCDMYIDGGIRRGTDVLKALALGAKAVMIGRPILWGLAVDGEKGATHVLQLLREELELAMALTGCPNIRSINKSVVRLAGFDRKRF
jgi:isopentenyl diphosphate isomerase/L-lactate dehydrogenase-like FMN-dependent dehydrogenase